MKVLASFQASAGGIGERTFLDFFSMGQLSEYIRT